MEHMNLGFGSHLLPLSGLCHLPDRPSTTWRQFTEKSRARVAQECSCTLTAVNDVILKYRWYESANHKMQKLKREGKPLPRTFEEVRPKLAKCRYRVSTAMSRLGFGVQVEKVVGSPKPSSQSPGGGVGSKISRNALCPCGSKKKYKR